MQLSLNLNTTRSADSWAFAKDPNRDYTVRRTLNGTSEDINNYVITACSREARRQGIHTGMPYGRAKALNPDLKIIAIGANKHE